MKKLLFLLPLLAAAPVAAQTVQDCDGLESARNIAEPWEENTRTFANGDVRIAVLETVEPAQGYSYLLILSPPITPPGDRQCRLIGSAQSGIGFSGISFDGLAGNYDPDRGLLLDMNVGEFDSDIGDVREMHLRVILNQETGEIDAAVTDITQ